ncbi:MAG: energy transducer TonB [Candidatus Eremiobacteraeota bacterium]|nr:energy transducer TonB [Candidatus Eremiobacteraeota bacterium]
MMLVFALSLVAPPPASAATVDTLAALAGRWHCTDNRGSSTERYYALFPTSAARVDIARTLYGREDAVEPDGSPSESFERIQQRNDGTASIESVEGTGTARSTSTAPLSFVGNGPSGNMTLTYAIDSEDMQRTVSESKTTSSERCTRVAEKRFDASCAQPNMPATVLHAEEPEWPSGALAGMRGIVYVVIVLDERSRILWTDIAKSDNSVFDEEAARAARLSKYRTEVKNCKPVAARYVFSVSFGGH